MIGSLALALTVVCALAGAGALAGAATGTFRRVSFTPVLVAAQIGLAVQGVFDLVALARGHRPAELATHVAYLVASLLIVPLTAAQTGRDDGRWSAVLLAVGLLAAAVLVVRMQATWR